MIVIANSNPIHDVLQTKILSELEGVLITRKEDLNADYLRSLSPEFIFFIHWSHMIRPEIYERFNCIVFHMTDLPYGRGGSPLQNLIVRGHEDTMISAIKVEQGLDEGDIYMKRKLSLGGTAEEIFLRAGKVMFDMIKEIVNEKPIPLKQSGDPVLFKRRQPGQSDIKGIDSLDQLHDFIRMLDAEGYPHAFFENDYFRFEITRSSLKKESIVADVRIIKKQ